MRCKSSLARYPDHWMLRSTSKYSTLSALQSRVNATSISSLLLSMDLVALILGMIHRIAIPIFVCKHIFLLTFHALESSMSMIFGDGWHLLPPLLHKQSSVCISSVALPYINVWLMSFNFRGLFSAVIVRFSHLSVYFKLFLLIDVVSTNVPSELMFYCALCCIPYLLADKLKSVCLKIDLKMSSQLIIIWESMQFFKEFL